MYRQLQRRVKEYIVNRLNKNSNGLSFDINTTDSGDIIVVCNSTNESVNIIIGQDIVPDYILNCI